VLGGKKMSVFNKEKLEKKKQETKTVQKKYTIMLVDDEKANLRSLARILIDDYNVITANNGQEALTILKGLKNPENIQLIISDQRMPELTGVEFLAHTYPIIPKTIRMILTGFTDIDAIIDAINAGKIYKFLTKPIEPEELKITVKRALESFELKRRMIEKSTWVLNIQQKLENDVKESFITNLSAEERKWLITAVKGMVLCNEKQNSNGVGYLKTVLSFLTSKEESKQLIDMISQQDKSGVQHLWTTSETAFEIATVLLNMAIDDGLLTPSEKEFFTYAGKKLGYNHSFCVKMLSWAEKQMVNNQSLRDIKNRSPQW
jgi:response regulator RpfG family c-di-GMP phosphodiesterase